MPTLPCAWNSRLYKPAASPPGRKEVVCGAAFELPAHRYRAFRINQGPGSYRYRFAVQYAAPHPSSRPTPSELRPGSNGRSIETQCADNTGPYSRNGTAIVESRHDIGTPPGRGFILL